MNLLTAGANMLLMYSGALGQLPAMPVTLRHTVDAPDAVSRRRAIMEAAAPVKVESR